MYLSKIGDNVGVGDTLTTKLYGDRDFKYVSNNKKNGSQFHPRLYRPCSSTPARIRWLYITSIQVVLSLVMRTFDLRPLDVVSWDIGPTPGVTSHSSCPYSLKTPRKHIKFDKDKFPNASTMYRIVRLRLRPLHQLVLCTLLMPGGTKQNKTTPRILWQVTWYTPRFPPTPLGDTPHS